MSTVREFFFVNSKSKTITLALEPWAMAFDLAPGASLMIEYAPNEYQIDVDVDDAVTTICIYGDILSTTLKEANS